MRIPQQRVCLRTGEQVEGCLSANVPSKTNTNTNTNAMYKKVDVPTNMIHASKSACTSN
jgi:hypothetical protein